jgi:hypothetical protein
MTGDALETYLNDHLAGSVIAIQIARRCEAQTRDDALKLSIADLIQQIESDQSSLVRALEALGAARSIPKTAMAITTSWAGWVRGWFSNRATTEVEDLEALCIGVWGKRLLWGALSRLPEERTLLGQSELERLAASAEAQEKELLRLRERSLARMLSGD